MTGQRGYILMIDGRPDNLRQLSEILIGAGYKVRRSLDAVRALEAAQLAPPDLILLDRPMAESNGDEVYEHLKGDHPTNAIPVIFLSAVDNLEDNVKAFEVGGVDCITKSFQRGEVLAKVTTHLKIQNLNRALQHQNILS